MATGIKPSLMSAATVSALLTKLGLSTLGKWVKESNSDITLTQNGVKTIKSEESGALVNTLHLKTGLVAIGKEVDSIYKLDVQSFFKVSGYFPITINANSSHIEGNADQAVGFGSDGHLEFYVGPAAHISTFYTSAGPDFSTRVGADPSQVTPANVTLLVKDNRATTGITRAKVVAGAGQSTNELFSILANDGTTGIFSVNPTIADYADNTAAVAAGLAVGKIYRTADVLKIVHT
jgi:hypothetical protein